MKIAIIGMGGIGGMVGGELAKVNPDTHFVARGATLEAIRQNGLRILSAQAGEYTVRPASVTDNTREIGLCDAVIFATKGQDLEQACRQAAPLIGEETIVLPLLNGCMLSDSMEAWLPACRLADGIIYVFAHIESPGVIRQTGGAMRLIAGMKDGSKPAALAQLAELLGKNAVIQAKVSDDINRDSWTKFCTMCANSAVFLHFDKPAGPIGQDPANDETLRQAFEESTAVAAAYNAPYDGGAQKLFDNFKRMQPETITSLYRDLSSGKPAEKTELFSIIGRMVDLAKAKGIAVPFHAAVLERYQSRGAH